ncbi:hypothetical protein [Rhizobium sp. PP-F2F-G48]|uniref:hypothetical protein n=1 Tax=Rhizobium sp. PP-F2F-G48 TaxID=2135651 RepID=UPI001046AA2C|nr:hypothetical protein [Rhizobium sp. PP-F2F-G48]
MIDDLRSIRIENRGEAILDPHCIRRAALYTEEEARYADGLDIRPQALEAEAASESRQAISDGESFDHRPFPMRCCPSTGMVGTLSMAQGAAAGKNGHAVP